MFNTTGVRGGVSTIITRYCRANNKYMEVDTDIGDQNKKENLLHWYNPDKKMIYILDLDANNLYGE